MVLRVFLQHEGDEWLCRVSFLFLLLLIGQVRLQKKNVSVPTIPPHTLAFFLNLRLIENVIKRN